MTRESGPWIPRALEALVPRTHRDEWLGDLVEEWHERVGRGDGRRRATLHLWRKVLTSALEAGVVEWRLGRNAGTEGGGMGRGLGQDLRLAVRILRREPAASGAAFGTLALGVWAFLTGFALVYSVLLQPLGYEAEERLAIVGQDEGALYGTSMPDHLELVEASDLFEGASVWQGWGVLLKPEEGPWTQAAGASVTSDHFGLLGVEPALGRLFLPEDDAPGHDPVVVLSHSAWQARFAGRRDVVGETIEHEGIRYTIVGVAEEGFRDPVPRLLGWNEPELWRASPPNFESARDLRSAVSFWTVARVRQGVPFGEVSRVVRQRSAEILGAPVEQVEVEVRPYADLHQQRSRASLLLLLAAGLTVLVVSAANLVNLLLARGTGRIQEMAVRSALGARRARLVGQLLVEGVVLGLVAAAVGVALTSLTLGPVVRLSSSLLPRGTDVGMHPAVVGAAVAIAVLAAAASALLPALAATRVGHLADLRQGGRGSSRRSPLQTVLVVTQTALAVVLVTASGLFLRTVWALGEEDIGFDADRVTATYVGLHGELFGDADDQSATLQRLTDRLEAIPGVEGAAAITDLPMSGRVNSTRIIRPEVVEGDDLRYQQTLVRAITPGYFEVMGMRPVDGRMLGWDDRRGELEVAVVNETYARRHFPGESPLGRSVVVRGVERQIVGIVEDVTEFTLGAPRDPVLYLTYDQEVQSWMRAGVYVALRTEGVAPSLASLQSAAGEVDPRVPVGSPFPLTSYVDSNTVGHRFRALLATSLGALALVLASVGLAGVTAYVVGRRTRELGVRVALGAGPDRIASMVLRGSGALTILGILIGVGAAIPTGQVLSGFLFGVSAVDLPTLAVAAGALGLTSLVASLVPLRRALRITPVDALREE